MRETEKWICRAATALGCSLLLLAGSDAAAQPSPQPTPSAPPKWQFGFDALVAVPVGDFANNVEDAAGIAFYLDWALKESVFSVGGELGWMTYGDTSRTVPLGSLIPEVPDASVKVVSDNQMVLLHARLRAQRRRGRWRPYADGQVGFTDLFTTTTVQGAMECSYLSCSTTEIADRTNAQDFVLSYGGSGGVMIGLRASPTSPKLDFAVRYHRGAEASYLTEGAIDRSGDPLILNISRSRTDMVIVYIGLVFGR